jgi:hypothetical protein
MKGNWMGKACGTYGWKRHVERMAEKKNAYRGLVVTPETV